MKEQEQEHLEAFNKLIVEKRVRPTALLPLWNVAGFALGRYKISYLPTMNPKKHSDNHINTI